MLDLEATAMVVDILRKGLHLNSKHQVDTIRPIHKVSSEGCAYLFHN